MRNEILNKTLFTHNSCYGCGHENINGLKIEIIKDPTNPHGLLAEFNARQYMEGLPGLIHSGSILTAMDCLAGWTATTAFPQLAALWMTQSCRINYMGPAFIDQPLLMASRVLEHHGQWNPVIVYTEAKNSSGEPVATAEIHCIPLSAKDYGKLTGISPLPQHWEEFLASRTAQSIKEPQE